MITNAVKAPARYPGARAEIEAIIRATGAGQ